MAGDLTLGEDSAVNEHDWDAEVVEAMQIVVGVDIGEVGVEAEVSEEAQSLIAEVAALSGH